jgi:diguanylate cyclase (GGDEF)-like protein
MTPRADLWHRGARVGREVMIRVHPSELQRLYEELQEAIRAHAAWHRRVISTLVCRLPPPAEDLGADAHLHCKFGTWFHRQGEGVLRGRPAWDAINATHMRLHELAARVLTEMWDTQVVSRQSFEAFVEAAGQMRAEIDALRHEVAAALRSRDTLTGVYGRGEILPALREARELGRRHLQPASVAFLDLDHFKDVNDLHGHGLGDEVLAAAARCITLHLRPYDKVFRYGGDEFLLLLPGTHVDDAHHSAERIRAGLAATQLGTAPDGERLHLTASFGVAALDTERPVEDSIARADQALLHAKATGRNRVCCWAPELAARSVPVRDLRPPVPEGMLVGSRRDDFSARPASPDSAVR